MNTEAVTYDIYDSYERTVHFQYLTRVRCTSSRSDRSMVQVEGTVSEARMLRSARRPYCSGSQKPRRQAILRKTWLSMSDRDSMFLTKFLCA